MLRFRRTQKSGLDEVLVVPIGEVSGQPQLET